MRHRSKKVAEYVYDAFYSPVAQAKLKPPRIELAASHRQQYRHSIADVIGSFHTRPPRSTTNRACGEYFNARNFRGGSRLIDRTDPAVDFDFGTTGPEVAADAKTKFDSHQFSIRWEGSVIAPETGCTRFVVRSDHAALWVNDPRALIDRFVKSGSETEFRRASIFLLAGRGYPSSSSSRRPTRGSTTPRRTRTRRRNPRLSRCPGNGRTGPTR